ncbi:hypothetical protein RA210_U70044 [Rubrivivax sp. A210]|uniref:hypothetical protein n=1 Tax=Rubrivivax sp. A210 TaxID=2772301 RepID=UPI00191AD4F4|nr:hypothetical protein [Rubrivivax sp. A210]CAD5374728.1 hypothetical protein RA210_U70044 [Rubrivivax sp. A210]
MRRASPDFALLVVATCLAGCATNRLSAPEPVATVKLVQTTTYPELPDIQMPVEPVLLPWEYEVPRDLSRMEPKSTPDCERVPDKERDDAFWARCGERPVIRDTNVLFGFDQRNWNILLSNFAKLREYIFQLRARVDLANESRREWRRRAEEERRRVDALTATAAPARPASAP